MISVYGKSKPTKAMNDTFTGLMTGAETAISRPKTAIMFNVSSMYLNTLFTCCVCCIILHSL